MPIDYPFYRCVRPGADGDYAEGGRGEYVTHPDYAPDATHYLRAFYLLQGDLLRLFEYVEPADANEGTYSYRCLELLLRACGEVEANCRAILDANGFVGPGRLTMKHYHALNATHHLSSYRVRLPVWTGRNAVRRPFATWSQGTGLAWFKAHHSGKHNRHAEFANARLGHVLDAIAGVVALLASQFITHDFGPGSRVMSIEGGPAGGFEHAIGGYFEVRFPDDWAADERYEFSWQALKQDGHPFRQLSF